MEEKKVEILSPPFLFNCDVALPLVFLETNNRPKGGLQITVRAIVEIHFVADIQPQSDRPEMSFETESDVSYTSLGHKALMAGFIHQVGGSASDGTSLVSAPKLPINRLRVLAPCVAQGTCQ